MAERAAVPGRPRIGKKNRDPTRDKYGLPISDPPDVDDVLQQLKEAGTTSTLALLKRRLAYDEVWRQEAQRAIQIQDELNSRETIKTYVGFQEALGQSFVDHNAGKQDEKTQGAKAQKKYSLSDEEGQDQQADIDNPAPDDATPRPPKLQVHPEVAEMCVNMHLIKAASILQSLQASGSNLDLAYKSAQNAYVRARTANYKPLIARCEFYLGLTCFRRGSIREAVRHFHEAGDAYQVYIEGEWARDWIAECERITEIRGDGSVEATPVTSPVTPRTANVEAQAMQSAPSEVNGLPLRDGPGSNEPSLQKRPAGSNRQLPSRFEDEAMEEVSMDD